MPMQLLAIARLWGRMQMCIVVSCGAPRMMCGDLCDYADDEQYKDKVQHQKQLQHNGRGDEEDNKE
jgi:hypothetical protein